MTEKTQTKEKNWEPHFTLEEKLKFTLTPPALSIRRQVFKALRRGESELHLLPFLVDRKRNCVDAGACWGVYSFLMSKLVSEVHAFEPNPKIFKILKRQMPKNVSVYPYALSNTSGSSDLRIPKGRRGYSNQGASLSSVKPMDQFDSLAIQTKKLDDMDINNVGFLKIDVEGFEKEVLEGASQLIKSDRPSMIIEIEEKHNQIPIEECIADVERYGYKTLFLNRNKLHLFNQFDAELNHRKAPTREDYVFNFIFLPT